MNPDGTEQTNLTNTPDLTEREPSWSPDGSRIAFVEVGDFGVINRLMVMNADGSARTAVTPEPSHQFGPTWSPDGTMLAFVRLVPGEVISAQFDILVANVDGTGEVNLTHSDLDERDRVVAGSTEIAFWACASRALSILLPASQSAARSGNRHDQPDEWASRS